MPETEPLLTNHYDYHSISDNHVIQSDDIQVITRDPEEGEVAQTEEHEVQTAVYGARWYILFILSFSTCLQNLLWGTWAPIADSAQFVMGWDTSTLFVVTNFGNLGNILPLVFTAYIAQNKEFKRIQHEIWQLLMIEFAVCGALFLSTLVYFPATPKLPPSVSAGAQRLNFKQGLIAILKQAKMWQVCLACSVPGGIYGNWIGMIFLIFQDIGITQVQAGWFGFLSCTVGAIGAGFLGRLASCFQQRLKLFLILLNVAIVAMVYWVICLSSGMFSNPTVMVAIVYVILGILSNTQFALSYEISCENGYPIHEGIIGTFLSLITNGSGMIFLSLDLIPGIGISWANWVLFGSFVFGTVLLLLYKETYRRFEIDCLHGEYFSKSIQN